MKQRLLDGETITLENEMGFLSCEISHGKTLSGGNAFKLFFNGAFVKVTKTWKPVENKLNQLISDYGLTEVA